MTTAMIKPNEGLVFLGQYTPKDTAAAALNVLGVRLDRVEYFNTPDRFALSEPAKKGWKILAEYPATGEGLKLLLGWLAEERYPGSGISQKSIMAITFETAFKKLIAAHSKTVSFPPAPTKLKMQEVDLGGGVMVDPTQLLGAVAAADDDTAYVESSTVEPGSTETPAMIQSVMDGDAVPLKKATALYQPVMGTDSGSRYHVIAIVGTIKLAARWKQNAISIRAESTLKSKLADVAPKVGLQKAGKGGHYSAHFGDLGAYPDSAEIVGIKTLAAFVAALVDVAGIENPQVADFKLIKGKGV